MHMAKENRVTIKKARFSLSIDISRLKDNPDAALAATSVCIKNGLLQPTINHGGNF